MAKAMDAGTTIMKGIAAATVRVAIGSATRNVIAAGSRANVPATTAHATTATRAVNAAGPSRSMGILLELFWTFARIGLFTFGGGYAMIALIEHACVEQKG